MAYESLALPKGKLGPLARPKRLASIEEAIAWPKGPSLDERVFTPIYVLSDGFVVGVEKPGKEAFEATPNVNDMLPSVYQHGRRWNLAPSFFDFYNDLQMVTLQSSHHTSLEIIAALLYRSSFMLDHAVIEGVYRWSPPDDAVTAVKDSVPQIGGLPTIVFLTLIEVVALQEDVKYATIKGDVRGGVGRTNNLQTCAYLIAVFLGRVSVVRFASALARTGVASIPQKTAPQLFPLLASPTAAGGE